MGDGRILPPRLRLYLYVAAGIILALWLSLEFLGAAGFVAFVVAMLTAQAAWRFRPSLNVAFFAGLAAYVLVLAVWTVAFGAPEPSKRNATETPVITSIPT